jgi:carbamoyl-phosphate synthase large subunit
MNILFLGGAKRVSIAKHFLHYGEKCGIKIRIFSYELDEKVAIASVGTVIVGLKWTDIYILYHLKETIKRYEINIVLPFVDPAIALAARLKYICPEVFIPVSEEQLCNVLFDKKKSAIWFKENNIAQPLFYSKIEDAKFPVILKPRKGSASKGIFIVNSCSEVLKDIDTEQYLIQEYICEGQEYSVDCYVSQDRRILSIVPRIRLEIAGGEAIKSVVVREEKIINEAKKILLSGNFIGPITIQFIKECCNNRISIIEINPRLGGAVVASIGAGSGMISLIINEAMNQEVVSIDNWKENTVMVRYFKEYFFYADNN